VKAIAARICVCEDLSILSESKRDRYGEVFGGVALSLPARSSAVGSQSGESRAGSSAIFLLLSIWRWPFLFPQGRCLYCCYQLRLHEVLGERPHAKPLTSCVSPSRDALDAAGVLYNRVDEGVHRLVMASNKRIQELELVMEFEKVEECFKEVSNAC